MEINIEGQTVKYVVDLPGCVPPYPEYVAIVTRDRSEDLDGLVDLCILMDTKITREYDVFYSDEKLPNTWHWIERWQPTKQSNVRNTLPLEMTVTP